MQGARPQVLSSCCPVNDSAGICGEFPQKRRVATPAAAPGPPLPPADPEAEREPKRLRLRPTIGQLRLEREAGDGDALAPAARLRIEPSRLRAEVLLGDICCGGADGADAVHLELVFPPQYPHKPPKVYQLSPDRCVPQWAYDGRCVAVPRLGERSWSSAMGVVDIIRELIVARDGPAAEPCGTSPQHPAASENSPEAGDVEMC